MCVLLAGCGERAEPPRGRPVSDAPFQADLPAGPTGGPTPSQAPGRVDDGPPADFEAWNEDLDWMDLLKPEDRVAVQTMPAIWAQVIKEVEASGYGADMRALGAATEPDAAFRTLESPARGEYACRTIQLGSKRGLLAFVSYPAFSCRISATPEGRLLLTKTTGSQRTQGPLYPVGDGRMLYVGGQAVGDDERGFPRYGDVHRRDDFGVLEQIGDDHWRIVMPGPRQHHRLEVLEIWSWPAL